MAYRLLVGTGYFPSVWWRRVIRGLTVLQRPQARRHDALKATRVTGAHAVAGAGCRISLSYGCSVWIEAFAAGEGLQPAVIRQRSSVPVSRRCALDPLTIFDVDACELRQAPTFAWRLRVGQLRDFRPWRWLLLVHHVRRWRQLLNDGGLRRWSGLRRRSCCSGWSFRRTLGRTRARNQQGHAYKHGLEFHSAVAPAKMT